MAKTPTERVREFRERQRAELEAQESARKAMAKANFRKPLTSFLEETGRTGFADHYLALGNDWWDFSDGKGSLDKAENILNVLEDVSDTLAEYVNAYKKKEIADRINEIENSDLSNPDKRKQAFADIHRLKAMLEQLDKPRRRNLPRWEVMGE